MTRNVSLPDCPIRKSAGQGILAAESEATQGVSSYAFSIWGLGRIFMVYVVFLYQTTLFFLSHSLSASQARRVFGSPRLPTCSPPYR
jgi:hypothetical protein